MLQHHRDAALQVLSPVRQRARHVTRGRVLEAGADEVEQIEWKRFLCTEHDVEHGVRVEAQAPVDGAQDLRAPGKEIRPSEPERNVLG